MHVLHYWPRGAAGDGGISRSLRALSSTLATLGVEVTIAYDEPGPALQAVDGVRWRRVLHTGPARVRIPLGLAGLVDTADVLILHSAWTAHNRRAASVARAREVPYVLAPRGAYDPSILARRAVLKRIWWRTLEHRVMTGARALHVFFESQRAHIRALGYDGEVIIAPNGVHRPTGVEWDGGSGEYLLYLGRFDPEHKGLDLLLRALASMPRSTRPRVRMHGSDWRGGKRELLRMVRELELDGEVIVGGPLHGTEKWAVLTRSRGLLYPSRWEAFGNSVAEAAAAGVPVLTTPYPLGEYLGQQGGALVVEPTTRELARGLSRLMGPEAEEIGKAGQAVVQRHLSWEAVAESWRSQLSALVDT